MTPWLTREEQIQVVKTLVGFGLIKFDNNRSLKLKSGGFTDIYINLRDARNSPAAMKYLSEIFAIALRRLNLDRFIEVPDAVSCFAEYLAILTNLPYLTIRETPKEGRVSDAKVIGKSNKGESVAIFDDVITDGASKIIPIRQCLDMELLIKALIILVDRQQGWQNKFGVEQISVPVWPGMTLHDVRKILIQDLGVMKRCDAKTETANPLIVALDGKSWEEILPMIDQLRTTGCILKVNDLLFAKGIENLLPDLSVYGRVMADLKCYDIPNTVANTCKNLRICPPWAVTVHASGGKEMIQAAVKALAGTPTQVLAVTVLTSFDEESCHEIYSRAPLEQTLALAEIAAKAGAHGFVCSPQETPYLRKKYPDMTIVNPGIRSAGKETNDQKRVDTPKEAVLAGAGYLVMGRQILGAPDPVKEVQRILKEELNIQ